MLFGNRIRRWVPLLTLFLGVGVLGAVRESRAGGDIPWAKNFETGVALARQNHKPLFLSFHAPGCGWCAKLDTETFTDTKVVDLARNFVCVRLESDVDAALVQKYGVSEYPMTVLVTSEGKELTRVTGYVPPERFAPALQLILQADATHKP